MAVSHVDEAWHGGSTNLTDFQRLSGQGFLPARTEWDNEGPVRFRPRITLPSNRRTPGFRNYLIIRSSVFEILRHSLISAIGAKIDNQIH